MSDGDPFSTTETLGADTIYPPTATEYISAYAEADKEGSSSSDASSFVYFVLG